MQFFNKFKICNNFPIRSNLSEEMIILLRNSNNLIFIAKIFKKIINDKNNNN